MTHRSTIKLFDAMYDEAPDYRKLLPQKEVTDRPAGFSSNRPLIQRGLVPMDLNDASGDIVSTVAQWVFFFSANSLIFFTVAIVLLIGLQTNTLNLTVKMLLYIISAHNFLSVVVLAMNVKISHLAAQAHVKQGVPGTNYLCHLRNDRRMMSFLLTTAISILATIHIVYVSQVIPNDNVQADDFIDTGKNTFLSRSLDLQFGLLLALALPMVGYAATEIAYRMQVRALHEASEENEEAEGTVQQQ